MEIKKLSWLHRYQYDSLPNEYKELKNEFNTLNTLLKRKIKRKSKIETELDNLNGEIKTREGLEKQYLKDWNKEFKIRLKTGHFMARLFRSQTVSQIAYSILKIIPFLLPKIIQFTHGKQIKPI